MKIIETSTVHPELVTVPDRLRSLSDKRVDEIAASIKSVGQISPILLRVVRDGQEVILIAGAHRLAAAMKLGLKDIDAVFIEGDDDELRLWEIAENLHRSELTPDERDQHVLAWEKLVAGVEKEVAETASRDAVSSKGGRGREGGNRKTARDTGTSESTVRRAKKLADLPPEIKEADISRAAKIRVADAPDRQVALQDEIEKKSAPKAPFITLRPCDTPMTPEQKLEVQDAAQWTRLRRRAEKNGLSFFHPHRRGYALTSKDGRQSCFPDLDGVEDNLDVTEGNIEVVDASEVTPAEILFGLAHPSLEAMSDADVREFGKMITDYLIDRPEASEAAA